MFGSNTCVAINSSSLEVFNVCQLGISISIYAVLPEPHLLGRLIQTRHKFFCVLS